MISLRKSVETQGKGSTAGKHLPHGGEGSVVSIKVKRIILLF